MAIYLSDRYLAELKKNVNAPDVILEFSFDSGLKKFGINKSFGDVVPIIKSVSSFQNKLDTKAGYTTRGELKVVLVGREYFKPLIRDEYLKNRRVTRKDGFIAPGFIYADYAATYTGIITDWSRKGDELTITISDDLVDATKNIPEENSTNTQYLDYGNMNPADIMTNILLTQLGIASGNVDSAKFTSEKNQWLLGWVYNRVVIEPQSANEYLNELQIETNSYIVHDGEKISFKVFAPDNSTVEGWTDAQILEGSMQVKSGYKDNFYNRVVVYYDYDESGSDEAKNFDSCYIAADAGSQGASQWDEVSTKTIKSKWIRSYKFTQPSNVTGVKIYYVSKANGAGAGALTYDNTADTLQWTPPGGGIGTAVEATADGPTDIYGSDENKFIRVLVTTASLPASNQSDTITTTAINGSTYAAALASRLLNGFRDPSATISFDVDINRVSFNNQFIKPTDYKDITTDEAFEKGMADWSVERMMLTSVRPDFEKGKVSIEAIETKLYEKYGFIAPAGTPDYTTASEQQKRYAFIKTATPQYFIF